MAITHNLSPRTSARFEERIDPPTGDRYLEVLARGAALKDDPILNKGTCFTLEEREELGLRGILPPAVSTPGEQETRAYENYLKAGDAIGRHLFLAALQDRNETLFYRLVLDHLEEMIPNTPRNRARRGRPSSRRLRRCARSHSPWRSPWHGPWWTGRRAAGSRERHREPHCGPGVESDLSEISRGMIGEVLGTRRTTMTTTLSLEPGREIVSLERERINSVEESRCFSIG